MKVVSFYTNDRYREMAEKMKASAESVGLDCHIYEYREEDAIGWGKILYLKPIIILRAMEEFGDDILWCDADTRFHQHPNELFQMAGDPWIAAYVEGKRYLWGGFMWVQNSDGGRKIMDIWQKENQMFPRGLDDHNCWQAIMKYGLGKHVHRLPPSYQWNGWISQRRFPGAVPVVEHKLVVTMGNKPLRAAETYDRPYTGE
jgi:hypothetical protein